MPGVSGVTVVTNARVFYYHARLRALPGARPWQRRYRERPVAYNPEQQDGKGDESGHHRTFDEYA